jgi:hypothetical protein
MPSAGFKTAIPAFEKPQTYALDRTATGIGHFMYYTQTLFVFFDFKDLGFS